METHARALLAERWPSAARTLAGRVVRRLGDGRRYSVREDLFGVFDGAALELRPRPRLALVQWTTEGAAAARRRKAAERFRRPLSVEGEALAELAEVLAVEVWGWRRRAGFRVWRFDFAAGACVAEAAVQRASGREHA